MRSRGTAFSSAGCAMAPPGPGGTEGDPEEAAEGPAVDGADAVAGAEDRALADSMAARISFLLMRPPAPLPSIPARSTWFSFARRRTRGELRISLPLPRQVVPRVPPQPVLQKPLEQRRVQAAREQRSWTFRFVVQRGPGWRPGLEMVQERRWVRQPMLQLPQSRRPRSGSARSAPR